MAVKILFCYAHEDESLLKKLKAQLMPMQRQGFIEFWHDRDINAGSEWEQEMNEQLNAAQIILLLISPDFMASDYCYSIEIKRAIERHEHEGVPVIPVILRPVLWQVEPLRKLQALPEDSKAVTEWTNRDKAFENIARGIQNLIEKKKNTTLARGSKYLDGESVAPLSENILFKNISSCPYRGLSAFREQDGEFFFGRETFTTQLVEFVQKKPFVAVIGPSGNGKSSLVFAGLFPHIRQNEGWYIASFRPSDRPFYGLASALVPALEVGINSIDLLVQTKKLAELFQQGEVLLHDDVVERIIQKQNVSRFLLFIDQFEEIYTINKDDRVHFLNTLLKSVHSASQQKKLNFTLVLTLRADFFGQALSYRPFADVLQGANLILGAMNRRELQDAIKEPIDRCNVKIEEGLIDRILDAVGQEPGNLPLLEFTLAQLWEKQQNRMLTHRDYSNIGGIEQSLVIYAEDIYGKLNNRKQRQMQRIFIQLIYPGEGTEDIRRIATRTQLEENSWDLVTHLSDTRLVVTGRDKVTGEEIVEIVHEALIKHWDRLRKWIEEDHEFRLWQERLRIRMVDWEHANWDESELLRGFILIESQKWLEKRPIEIPALEQDFIRKSLEQQTAEEKLKNLHLENEQYQHRLQAMIAEHNQMLETNQLLEQRYQGLYNSFQDAVEDEATKMVQEAAQTLILSPERTPALLGDIVKTLEAQAKQTEDMRTAELLAVMRQAQYKSELLEQEITRERKELAAERQGLNELQLNISKQARLRYSALRLQLQARWAARKGFSSMLLLLILALLQIICLYIIKVPMLLSFLMPIVICMVLVAIFAYLAFRRNTKKKRYQMLNSEKK